MHRFYLPPEQTQSTKLALAGREAHHATYVLRVQDGERVAVLDGAGTEFLCRVQYAGRGEIHLQVLEHKSHPPPSCKITLLQAVPKGKIMESIVQKAVELGAHRIVPLLSERVTTRLDSSNAVQKAAKWQLVAVEAIKQCGAAWLPHVESAITPREFLSRKEQFDLPLIASLQPGSRHARAYFRAFADKHARSPQSVCIWVGPEGDFTPAEVSDIQSSGALPITLGPLVLRCETAAAYCLSILNYELLQAESWTAQSP